jgi:hypothetical protein
VEHGMASNDPSNDVNTMCTTVGFKNNAEIN